MTWKLKKIGCNSYGKFDQVNMHHTWPCPDNISCVPSWNFQHCLTVAAVCLLPPGSHWLKDHQAWDRPPCSTPPTLPRSTTQVWKGIEEVIICDLQYQNGLTKKGKISWMCKHYQPKSNESVLNLWEQPKSTESFVKCEEKKLSCHLQVPILLFSRTVSNLYHSLLLQVQRLFHWGL